MENEQNNKKISLSTTIIFIVLVLAIIGFFVFKANKGEGDLNVENATTTTDQVATTTENNVATTSNTVTPPTSAPKPAATIDTGVKVIQGNGYTATLKPVYGEAPVINSFTMVKVDETCRFTWDVSKAKRCDFLNADSKTGFKDVGAEGTVQMNDAGNYIVRCYGDGGKSTTSEVVSCK